MSSVVLLVSDLFRTILTLAFPIVNYILSYVYRLLKGPTKPLPPIDSKILLLSANELAEKIRKKQLSCKEVMRAYIQRSQLIHPMINAVTDARYVDALQDAVTVDRFLERGEKTEEQIAMETPLLGVPFTCKEVLGIKGLKQTNGLVRAKGHIAEDDCDAAVLYKKAGAIPVTVTNVPEICMWWQTSNNIYGETKNPYDNFRTPGGSTGGEAALLTGAGAIIGIGTDIGGSIRIPSAFCGIYGHKPSRGLVPNWGSFPYCHMTPDKKDTRPTLKFISTGPMCRYARDLPLLMKILSGYDKRIKMDEKVNFRKVKVYYLTQMPGMLHKSRSDVKNAIMKASKHFEEEYGIKATPLNIAELEYAFPMWIAKMQEVGAPPLKDSLQYGKGRINVWWELFKSFFNCSDHTIPLLFFALINKPMEKEVYQSCLEMYKKMEEKFEDVFREDAILLFPTHPEPAPHNLLTIIKFKNVAYTCIFNILGYPCTSIPTGLSNGLPVGIQAISGKFKDHLTIAAAQELDKVFGGWISPCPVNA